MKLVEIRIFLLSHGYTIKSIVSQYPRKDGGIGVTRGYFYELVKQDGDTVLNEVRKIVNQGNLV